MTPRRLAVLLRRELLDAVRDRRAMQAALLFPLLGPACLALLLATAAHQAGDADEQPAAVAVVGAERAPHLVAFLREAGARVDPPPPDPEAAVRAGEAEVVLVVPEAYPAALREGRPAPLRLVFDASRPAARSAAWVRAALGGYAQRLAVQRLLARGAPPELVEPLAVEEGDVSTARSRGALLLSMLPYFLVMAVFMGGLYVAIDATAGERERGALEPLLLHPVTRTEVVLAKTAATAAFALAALVEAAAAFALVPRLLPLERLGPGLHLDPALLLGAIAILLPFLLLASAVMVTLAARARSFKAAQASLSAIALAPALPGLLLAVLPIRPAAWMLLVPALGEQLLLRGLLRGEAASAGAVALVLASSLAWAAAVVALTVRAFRDERFLFR